MFVEQSLIFNDNTRVIYRFKSGKVLFYLVIPKNNRVNLCIDMEVFDDSNINSIKLGDSYACIVPILDVNIRNRIIMGDVNFMGGMDKYISECLNLSHKILTHNNISVDGTVYYNHVDGLEKFESFFGERYKDRVKVINEKKESILESNDVGLLNNQVQRTPVDIPMSSVNIDTLDDGTSGASNNRKEMGFVSYVLLGVVFAVLSLLFLYFIV